nr:hypothetical protein PJ912_04250 [Pectobacterium colocasium]
MKAGQDWHVSPPAAARPAIQLQPLLHFTPRQFGFAQQLDGTALFSPYGTLSNTGIYYFTSGNSASQQDGYQRFDTYWRYNDNERMITYQVGDLISNSLTWSNSVRMGGLRVARNFGLRPDIVTYPMLQYTGTAAVPSTLDLFINGYKANSTSLNAGPFTLTNTPYLNGAGEATVITTDAQGRQISTTIPFYVSNALLREGLSDFDCPLAFCVRTTAYRIIPTLTTLLSAASIATD